MKTNKKAISLIVLVITIIILGILATTVIISLSNTNIIEEANNAVNQYNVGQLKQAVMLTEAEYMSAHDGTKPNTFELIDILEEKEIITTEQKKEMLKNNGKLQIGDEDLELDKSLIITTTVACDLRTTGEYAGTYRLRFVVDSMKGNDDINIIEHGIIVAAQRNFNTVEGKIEDVFTLEGIEANGLTAKVFGINSNQEEFKYLTQDNPNVLRYAYSLVGMLEEQIELAVVQRSYIKYVKDGVEGIMYSDIITCSCKDVLV